MRRVRQVEKGIRRVDLTNVELASSETARRINCDIILQLIRSRQPISRAELARLSGLQRSTVSQITEQLIRERWIREGAIARLPRGRRPTMLVVNDDLLVLAVDIRPLQVTVATIDLNGRLLARAPLPLSADPAKMMASIASCMQRMQEAHPGKSFEGVGVSLPGRVDEESQCLIFAPNLNWPAFDIRKTLERALHLPVELENAANACLTSELWFGRMDGVQNAVLVTISEGLGAGILANGQLVTGEHGMAGEFGHISLDPNGPECGCNLRGCWEAFASCGAALRYYHAAAKPLRRISYEELLALAEEEDAEAVAALSEQARYIGRGLRLVTAALSPQIVLIAGDVTAAWGRMGPIVQQELRPLVLAGPMPRIQPTYESEVARLRGAAAMLLQRRSLGAKRLERKPRARRAGEI